jgi:hypothetical protein
MAVTPLTITNWARPVNNSTVQEPSGTVANVSGGGNSFVNDGRVMLQIINSTAASTTVTLDITKTVGGAPVTDPVISLAATIHNEWYGPFDPAVYGDTIVVTASANTVKFNVYHLP